MMEHVIAPAGCGLGTMHIVHTKGADALYCVDTHLKVQKKLNNVTISNGIAWSLNNKRLYYIDSPTQVVQSFIFEEDSYPDSGNVFFTKVGMKGVANNKCSV